MVELDPILGSSEGIGHGVVVEGDPAVAITTPVLEAAENSFTDLVAAEGTENGGVPRDLAAGASHGADVLLGSLLDAWLCGRF